MAGGKMNAKGKKKGGKRAINVFANLGEEPE